MASSKPRASRRAGSTSSSSTSSPSRSRAGLFRRVDLGALQLAGVVDVDRLPFREDVERGLTCLAVAVPRVLGAAEGKVYLGADRTRVDVRDAGVEVPHGAKSLVDVA